MSAQAQPELVRNEHKAQCPECEHTEYGDSDQEAFQKLAVHVQAEHSQRFAAAAGNVIPLKKKG